VLTLIMNHFSFSNKRSSYEQLENNEDNVDIDDGSSTSSSASSCHSKDDRKQHHYHQHRNIINHVSMISPDPSTSSSLPSAAGKRRRRGRLRRWFRRRRPPQECKYIMAIMVFLLGVIFVHRRRHGHFSSTTTTTTTKPAVVVHKERLPTFFSLHDGDDYLYALDNALYRALESATFHNNNNNNLGSGDASATATATTGPISSIKINITPSRIRSHDGPLHVAFAAANEQTIHDDDVLIFLCGDNADKVTSPSTSSIIAGVQQYSDIVEAATMAQVKTTHHLNLMQQQQQAAVAAAAVAAPTAHQQQQFGSEDDLGHSPAAAAAASHAKNASSSASSVNVNHHEWFIPYMPMIRQPVCHFVLYRPRGRQQQPRYNSNDDDNDNVEFVITDYDLVASSNLVHITSVLEPSLIHLAGTSSPTEMLVSFTTAGAGGGGANSSGPTTITPVAVYSRVSENYITMTPRTAVGNDNDFITEFLQERQDDEPLRITGTTTSYTAHDLCSAPANIAAPGKFTSPGLLHTVALQDLIPNAWYQYRVGIQIQLGDSANDEITYHWSDYFAFQAAPAAALSLENDDDNNNNNNNNSLVDFEPFAYLVYGDQGCPREGWRQGAAWTASMVTREVLNARIKKQHDDNNNTLLPVRAVHHIGDLSYAQGYAHQWDEWFQMMQPMVARVPFHIAVGNHEYDYLEGGDLGKDPSLVPYHDNAAYATNEYLDGHGFHPDWGDYNNDSGGECGVPTSKRFTMPSSSSSTMTTTSNGVFWYSHIFASVHTIVLSSEHDLDYGSPQHDWIVQELSAAVNRSRTPWLVVEMHRPLYEGEAKWPENNVGIVHRQELEDLFFDYNVDVVFAGHYHAYHRTCDGLYQNVCNQGGPLHVTVGTAGGLLDVEPLYKNDWSRVLMENEYGYCRVSVHNRTTMHIEFVRAGALDDPRSGQVLDDVWVQREH
jgi:acid phosphatase type 7